MIRQEEVYKIGRLGKPHGVKGEISLLFTDDVFDRVETDYLVLDIDGILVPFFIEEYRFHGNETALIKFCDINTQDKARELTGDEVFFPANCLILLRRTLHGMDLLATASLMINQIRQ